MIAALFVAVLSIQCSYECTLRACHNTLYLQIYQEWEEPISEALYNVTFTASNGVSGEFEFDIEHTSDGQAKCDTSCTIVDGFMAQVNLARHIDVKNLPATIDVEVRSGGVLLASKTMEPEFEVYWCNGSHCDSEKNFKAEELFLTIDQPPDP